MSNPDLPGAYPPDPRSRGRVGAPRNGQRANPGGGYGGYARRGSGGADRGYGREPDYGWDRAAEPDPGSRGAAHPVGGGRGSRRAPRGRRAGSPPLTTKERLAARLGTGGYPDGDYPGGGQGGGFLGRPLARDRALRRAAGMRGGNGRGGNGGGPGRPRQKGDWWRHWTWKKALGVAGGTVGGFIVLLVIGSFYAYSQTPIPVASQFATGQATRVYFRDGHTLVGMFGSTDRQILTSNQIPAMVKDAMVAAEDKHFYNEGGISPLGIIRAAITDLTSGSVQQGGSTITQQLVRNYYLGIGTAETATRKIKEIFVAEKLAQAKSKDWILTNYMNTVPTGPNMYGFGAAAQTYFGKPVNKLTVAQAAMIAAMPQAPSLYNPDPKAGADYQALAYRWHYVLNTMVQMGTLTQQEANAQKFPKVVKAFNNSWSGYRGYIMQAVQNELENTYHYTASEIGNGGLTVVTTFSKPMMNSLYASVQQEEKLFGRVPKYVHAGAVLEQPGTGEIWAMYSGPNFNAKNCKAIRCQWDMALQNREQVGSSFKPYVLALARQQGMSVKTSTLDGYSPLWIPPVSQPMTYASRTKPTNPGSWYQVGNDAGDPQANGVTVVRASAESLNTAYTDLYHRVAGTDGQNIVTLANNFGVDTKASGLSTMRSEVGTALGQASLTVEEQASTFATLANNGMYITPHVILRVQQQKPGAAMTTTTAKPARHMVLNPQEASDVDYALSFDTKPGGTAATAGLSDGRPVIAKTGTTNLSQSAFFIGAIPQFSLAVGLFTNQQGCPARVAGCQAAANQESAPPPGVQTLYGLAGLQGYGGQEPATIWHNFMEKEFLNTTVQQFPTPEFGGTRWNLLGPYTPKPKPKQTCQGFQFFKHCVGDGSGNGNGNGNGDGHGHPIPSPNPTIPIPSSPATTPSFPNPTPTATKRR